MYKLESKNLLTHKDFTDTTDFYYFSYGINENSRVLDIGFGEGIETVYFAKRGFKVLAIDSDVSVKNCLLKNIEKFNLCDSSLIDFYIKDVFEVDFKQELFSTIVVYNVIHFLNDEKCFELFKIIDDVLEVNGQCYIKAHHEDHPENKESNDYFKQFFTKARLMKFIDTSKYEILRYSFTENLLNEPVKNNKIAQKYQLKFPSLNESQIELIIRKIV